MAAKRGLNMGRGLESLFGPGNKAAEDAKKAPESAPKAAEDAKKAEKTGKAAPKAAAPAAETAPAPNKEEITSTDGVLTVKIAEIVPNAAQPRKNFDDERIGELAASIKEFGVLQPLLVQKNGDKYELIAGERRYRAAKQAGLPRVPVLVREYSDRETFEISLIENLQRENLNAIEEAQAYQRLVEEFNLTQEEVAGRVSKSRAAVTNSLRLLKLPPEVQQLLITDELQMGHARALLGLPEGEMQVAAAKQVASAGLSVRDTEKLVRRLLKPAETRTRSRAEEQLDAALRTIEERLRKVTGTKVNIHKGRGQTGRVEIEYYSNEDLERIVALLGREGE